MKPKVMLGRKSLSKLGEKNPMFGTRHTDAWKKAMSESMKGRKMSEEFRRKTSERMKASGYVPPSRKGAKHSRESNEKNRIAHVGTLVGVKNPFYGKKHPPELQASMVQHMKDFYVNHPEARELAAIKATGRKQSKETIEKRVSKMRGELHHAWQGGISKNPYPKEFNYSLKLEIRTRDNFTCCRCGKTEREELEEINRVLCVNHIDFDKENLYQENLNTLCLRCNVQINRDRDYWTDFFQRQNHE